MRLPLALIACGLALVLWRPEWTSVATLLVLAVLAVLLAANEALRDDKIAAGARVVEELRSRDDERAAALVRHSQRLAEAEARIQTALDALERIGRPTQKARL